MSIVDDTRKSLYAILAKRVKEGNQYFTVLRVNRGGCYSGKNGSSNKYADKFQVWADKEAEMLRNVSGNIIPVDDSILDGFPEPRPPTCVPLDSVRIMLDKDGYQTNDPTKNVVRSTDGNVTHDWIRAYWFRGKKRDFYLYKEKIDEYVKTLQKSSIVASSSLIPLAIIAFLLLYSRGGKK
jgi:hypothetical protein